MYDKTTLGFRCPICRSGAYERVVVRGTSGKPYTTEFLQCAGCTVIFRDAVRFTRFEPYVRPSGIPMPAQPVRDASTPAEKEARADLSDRELKRLSRLERS